jgi:hypothetical protein
MKCDSWASLLTRTFASHCLGCELEVRVVTSWLIWKVYEWLWTRTNNLIMIDYEHEMNMNDCEWLWMSNEHKWLWTTVNIYEWLWASVNACEWLWVIMKICEHEWLWMIMNIKWTLVIVRFLSNLWVRARINLWMKSKSNLWVKTKNDLWVNVRSDLRTKNNLWTMSDLWMNNMGMTKI